jgi:hypothetical protein
MNKLLLLLTLSIFVFSANAQQDSSAEEMIDFSQFEVVESTPTKRYTTNKVLGLSPTKLISIGYDYAGAHTLTNYLGDSTPTLPAGKDQAEINSTSGLRIIANYPIISNTKWLVNLGGSYWRSNYNMKTYDANNSMINSLKENGLTSASISTVIFKPLNEKFFILGLAISEFSGDFKLNSPDLGQYLGQPKISAAAFLGKKRNDRSLLAFGLSRTYRPGALGMIPLIMFNHTFENRKWGIESFFPARAAVRRTINSRNMLFFGYELEGTSYGVFNLNNTAYPNNLELRRSELRPRITYECSLVGFIWLSVQAGYRINYNFNVDEGDKFRFIGSPDTGYHQYNVLTNPLYFQVSLNLVSP